MNPTSRIRSALPVLFAALLVPGVAWPKASDRNQPMTVDSSRQEGSLTGDNGMSRFTGNVVITQGTLEIHADSADVYQKSGDIDRVVFVGKQATLKQQLDDGTWMNARADNLDYNVGTDVIVLTGNYMVQSDRGTNTGQRMTYNTRTGDMQSGGDGTRVRTVIPPKKPPATPAKPSTTPEQLPAAPEQPPAAPAPATQGDTP